MMPRPGKYIFKRKGSNNWWLRLQYTGRLKRAFGAKKEFSLGTPDYAQAEINAMEHIKEHKIVLFAEKHLLKHILNAKGPFPQFAPNRPHYNDDGELFFATETELTFYDKQGNITKTEPNPRMMHYDAFSAPQRDYEAIAAYIPEKKHLDNNIIEDWISHRNLNKHLANEARAVWVQLQEIIKRKRLSKCTREDAKGLVRILKEEGNKSSTIEKKIGHLRAAVNFAISEGKLESNPFNKVVPRMDDQTHRLPLSDEDMALFRTHLSDLSTSDQLLWKLLATTGMRLNEPFNVTEEYIEDEIRYIIVGTKTLSSKRRIPLPSSILSHLPTRISGPLFVGNSDSAAKRFSYKLRQLGISYHQGRGTGDKRKVVHSLRHRAKDRLRAAGCPIDIQYEILGHEVRTVASGYGRGYPVAKLLYWIDKIGH